ncbi:TRAP transporter small permease subunit [Rhodoferax sp.]|uniref:TRAP transporter small permease subunit n=1 Tax=Rhodoferax sp. TaxID=50421 RepID=UPI00283C6737|nr:TRAP transporter small permease subunit [Rhodoferax sp.]MDR3369782.1 TRAP transporter small permease subunit [Rhodoferax sp.]
MVQKLIGQYCRLLTVIMMLMVFSNAVMRYAFNSGISISEELSRWLFLWLIFFLFLLVAFPPIVMAPMNFFYH